MKPIIRIKYKDVNLTTNKNQQQSLSKRNLYVMNHVHSTCLLFANLATCKPC